MIKTIIKRNKQKEPFSAEKLNGWGIWAAGNLGKYVNWPEVILETVAKLPQEISAIDLQNSLIDTCLYKKSWSYNRMAGRLYAAKIVKDAYGTDVYPHIKDVHKKMVKDKIMYDGFMKAFSVDEYDQINAMLNHQKDFDLAYFQIQQSLNKYALKNRKIKSKIYETPQFTAMRVAMRLAQNKPNRLKHIERFYYYISNGIINIPTPYYTNAGTQKNGFNSCCVYKTKDTVQSLAAGDHIAYTMTYSSAGIGALIETRSLGDEVRGGIILHQGKLPYYRALVGAIKANLQNGRGGAATVTYYCYDPEVFEIQKLKNPLTPAAKQIRGCDYSMAFNEFFARKAAANDKVALFSIKDAPDIYEALVDPDQEKFKEVYDKAIAEKRYHSFALARDILLGALTEAVETGRHYYTNLTEMNRHTPFKDPIWHSNLCVHGDTKILTKTCEIEISKLENQFVEVWNGKEWSEVQIIKTGKNQKLMKVSVAVYINGNYKNNSEIVCTEHHKWYDVNGNELRTKDLNHGLKLLKWINPEGETVSHEIGRNIEYVENGDTYCFTEPKEHKGVFNGVLTGQCQEIALPNKGYNSVKELYETEYNDTHGEVAMCSLAGIVVSNVKDEKEYAEAAYYCLLMIHTAIHESEHELPQIGITARARNSAGVGILGLAHHLAKQKLSYMSQEGRNEIHKIAERHYWYLVNASLELSKEYGLAAWMNKTKWPEGWLPIDTYNKNIDSIVTVENQYDWEDLRKRIIANGGIHNSVLTAAMPSESSSLSSGTTNSIYPIRMLNMLKTNDTDVLTYAVPDSEKLEKYYELAYNMPTVNMKMVYGIVQKFTDQTISADDWKSVRGDTKISSVELLQDFFDSLKYGNKTRYYINFETSKAIDLNATENMEDTAIILEEDSGDEYCESCTL